MAERRPGEIDSNRGARSWLTLIGLVLLILFLVLNLQSVEVNLIVAKVEMPLIAALAIAAGLGALIAWALPRVRRSRRS